MEMLILVGCGVGVIGLLGIMGIRSLKQDLPLDLPPTSNYVDLNVNKQLLLDVPIRKIGQRQPLEPEYNRPMDVIPDDAILPPPRDITGINGEN